MTLKELRLWHTINVFAANTKITEGCTCSQCARLTAITDFHLGAVEALSTVVQGDAFADLEAKIAADLATGTAPDPNSTVITPTNKTAH